jgi:hypothetical protein
MEVGLRFLFQDELEAALKYKELIFDLYKQWLFCIFTTIRAGLSGRMTGRSIDSFQFPY